MPLRSIKDDDPELRAEIAAVAELHKQLVAIEIQWRDKQVFLQSRGYMLRPRYHPDWIPSWELPENVDIDPACFEDYIVLPFRPGLIDATRMSDGARVYIKRVRTASDEARIATFFASDELVNDPRNHCVPVLDLLLDDEDSAYSYMVMPLLRRVDNPPFETPADVIDFVDQILEGLTFIHAHRIAHRDCAYKNIMMDANALFPEGFHPAKDWMDPTGQEFAQPLPRSSAPVRYYFTDFGISVRIPQGQPSLALGGHGLDQSVPELSFRTPYNPFSLDICILGNMLRDVIYKKYANVDFLRPLIDAMTHESPDARPSAKTAQRLWRHLKKDISPSLREWRLRSRDEYLPQRLVRDGAILLGHGINMARRLFGWISDIQG